MLNVARQTPEQGDVQAAMFNSLQLFVRWACVLIVDTEHATNAFVMTHEVSVNGAK